MSLSDMGRLQLNWVVDWVFCLACARLSNEQLQSCYKLATDFGYAVSVTVRMLLDISNRSLNRPWHIVAWQPCGTPLTYMAWHFRG